MTTALKSSYIHTLSARLESLLPNRTGYQLSEVELNAHFVTIASLLQQNCKRSDDQNGYFSEIVDSLIAILKKINLDSANKLVERDGSALSSTLIVSKLLRSMVSQNWAPREKDVASDITAEIYINLTLPLSEESFEFFRYPQPQPLDLNVSSILETLFSILSPRINRSTYSFLKRKPVSFSDCDFSVSPHINLSHSELLSYMAQIDTNLIMVIRFLAAANPDDYFSFVKENLLSWPDRGDMIPQKSLIRYSCSLMFTYTDVRNADQYLKLVYKSIPYISSNAWTQVFLYYACLNLKHQSLHRIGFYNSIFYPGSHAEVQCKFLFDFVFTAFENSSPEVISLFSWFALACPSDLDEAILPANKLKQAFNKRTKFLMQLLKNAHAFDPISYEVLNDIFLLGALIEPSSGGASQFSIENIEEYYRILLKLRPENSDVEANLLYRGIFVDISTAALMLHSNEHTEIFCDQFQSLTANLKDLFQSPTKIQDFKCLLDMIQNLSRRQGDTHLSSRIMEKINRPLLDILSKTTELLVADKSMRYNSLETSQSQSSIGQSSETSNDCDSELSRLIEEIHNAILELYIEHPTYYLGEVSLSTEKDLSTTVRMMVETVKDVFRPIEAALRHKSSMGSKLFNTACSLASKLLSLSIENGVSRKKQAMYVLISQEFIYSTCEVLICLSDLLFKDYFIALNKFSHYRHEILSHLKSNDYLTNPEFHYKCSRICGSADKLLVLSLCTHKVEFLSVAKSFMKAYLKESTFFFHPPSCFEQTLLDSFHEILKDDTIFSGFVSLNKQFKSFLINAAPTQGLSEAWVLIYHRWLSMSEDERKSRADSFSFKNFTEFLVCTSGILLSPKSAGAFVYKDKLETMISTFFDKAVDLLHSDELYIRVVVRDALSAESSNAVYVMTLKKLMDIIYGYKHSGNLEQEAIQFVEEAISVFASMTSLEDDFSFVLTSLHPGASQTLFDLVTLVPSITDRIKLRLRLCKMMSAVSTYKVKLGLRGAHQLRNVYAKTVASWLSTAMSLDETSTPITGAKTSDTEYLKIELATECSKSLELQLQSLNLVVPEETKEVNYLQAKERVFSEYFTLFYQILENFNSKNPSPLMKRSKFKTQAIVDNILKAISNILKANSEVGIQFALPLGYHGNPKMRSMFLEIFAATLRIGEDNLSKEEFPDEIIQQLSDVYPIYGAAAKAASPAEHNLLATSLHGLFGYTMSLDKLFITLLQAEIDRVTRPSDIFRSNSTLTRLMSIFAKEYGLPYLSVILRPFIEDIVDENVIFEVEREDNEKDSAVFIECLQRLVDSIVNSMSWVPDTFKFICSEIYKCISKKFETASLNGVGSFLFLRFFCPAVVSPESFFDLTSINLKVKRSLIQLVKVIQYMANGSISNLKWASLAKYSKELEDMNAKIFKFMEDIALGEELTGYQFHRLTVKPLTSLRYIHKFLHVYFIVIRHNYVVEHAFSTPQILRERINVWRKLDEVFCELGHPKLYISLQGTKLVEPQLNIGSSQFGEFMAKMSAKNIELSVDTPAVQTSSFHDGTPTIVVNFRYLRDVGYDMNTFVYLFLESASQIWDKKYYCVYDFTEFFYMGIIGSNYVNLIRSYAPQNYYVNYTRAYFYNIPKKENVSHIEELQTIEGNSRKSFYYSEQDSPEIANSLCLEDPSAMRQDVRLVCESCKLYDEVTEEFKEVTIKLGRQWLQIWYERFDYECENVMTDSIAPVETHLLADVIRCEVSSKSGEPNEFTLFSNRFNYQLTLVTPRRQEILRFLYFAKLKATKHTKSLKSSSDAMGLENSKRFSLLSNLMFHGLLDKNEELRLASSKLVSSFVSYYGVMKEFPSSSVISVAFPDDTTEFVVQYSSRLAELFPQYTFSFMRSFFDVFEKLPSELRTAGISYLSPWIDNLSSNLYQEKDGASDLAYTIRHLAKITTANKKHVPFFAEYIWNKLFEDRRITPVLVDELVSLAIENVSDPDAWTSVMALFKPGVEICGELIMRLNDCISKTKMDDSEIAIQSKQLEIKVLVKICASLFFNSYIYASLYLSEVFLFCTIFIAGPSLDIGVELQRLVLNTIQSFSMKPRLRQDQRELINTTLAYFSSQRAKMLFGLTAKEGGASKEKSHSFDKAQSFEDLFEHLETFIQNIGEGDDKRRWMSRWSSIAKDLAFGDSYYCDRAISVVCTLARSGISDSSGGKVLALITKRVTERDDFLFENSISFYRLLRGLSDDSVYSPSLLWSVLAALLIEVPYNHQTMTTYLGTSLKRLTSDASFFQKSFEMKEYLNNFLCAAEERSSIRITQENYELAFLIIISKGLALHRQRHCSISNYELILGFKTPETVKQANDLTSSFLLIYYLAVSNSTFVSFIEHSNFKGIELLQIGKDSIPKIVMDQILDRTPQMCVTFLVAAFIFASDCDQVFRWKFIALYTQIIKESRELPLTVFHIIQDSLQKSLNDHISIGTMNELSKIIFDVIEDKSYDIEQNQAKISDLMQEFSLQGFENSDFYKSEVEYSQDDIAIRGKVVLEILKKILVSSKAGAKLDKY